MRVFVYFNLHRKCWSIKALEGPDKGRVIAHAHAVEVHDVTFKVSQAGRARVLREQRKNVHAGIVGKLWGYISAKFSSPSDLEVMPDSVEVTYNPYKYSSFVRKSDGVSVTSATGAILNRKSVMAYEVL